MFFGIPDISSGRLFAFLAVMACFFILTLWSIWHAMHRKFDSTNEKVFWVQLTILVPIFGGIAYALWGRKRGQPS